MMNKKQILVPEEFVVTLKKRYPFAKSVTAACQKLNEEIKWTIGLTNEKIFNVKKR